MKSPSHSSIASLLAIMLLVSAGESRAQTQVYVPEGWLFGYTYSSTSNGYQQNGGTTIIPPTAPTGAGMPNIINPISSPEGGSFVAGTYQGTGNWVEWFATTGIPLNSFIDSSGNSVPLVDQTNYTATFWMRGNELNDPFYGDQGFMFDNTVSIGLFDNTDTSVFSGTTNVAFSANDWTQVDIPFFYDASSMANGTLKLGIQRAATDWDYAANNTVTAQILPFTVGTTGFDFVTPVPEPTTGLLAIGGILLLSTRRCRRQPVV